MNTLALEILNGFPFQMHVAGVAGKKIKLYIHAWGLFPTSGWTNPSLVLREPRPGTESLSENYAEFDLFAVPPKKGDIVLDVHTPVVGEVAIEISRIVHGVRVYGQKNYQETFVRFETVNLNQPTSARDSFVPIPWLVA